MAQMLPLLVFTLFGGAAAGAVVGSVLCAPSERVENASLVRRPYFFALACLVLLCIGLVGTLAHLGQPMRFINGLSNPSSMISQEAYWSIALVIVLLAETAFETRKSAPKALIVIGALIAVGVMVVTSLAYYNSLGIPEWNGSATFGVFIIGNLALGTTVCATLLEKSRSRMITASALAAVALLVVCIAYQAHLLAVHSAYNGLPLITVATIAGGIAPACLAFAKTKGVLTESATAWVMLACSAIGVIALRVAFFSAGMA